MKLSHTKLCARLRKYFDEHPLREACDGRGACRTCDHPDNSCQKLQILFRLEHMKCLTNLAKRQIKAAHNYPGDGKSRAAGA